MRFERYSRQAAEAVLDAEQQARQRHHGDMTPEHLLLAFLKQERGAFVRLAHGLSLERDILFQTLHQRLEVMVFRPLASGHKPGFSPRLLTLFRQAEQMSGKRGSETVQTTDLLLAMLDEGRGVAREVMLQAGVERLHLQELLKGEVPSPRRSPEKADSPRLSSSISSSFLSASRPQVPTSITTEPHKEGSALQRYGHNWTQWAQKEADALVERRELLRSVQQILCRRSKNNPLLIGEPGVGRTSLVKTLALRLARGEVPSSLAHCQLVALDVGALLAGARYRGDLEERFQDILREISQSRDEIILLLPDLHEMLRSEGGGGQVDLGRILKPALLRGELRCIATTTPSGFRQVIEKDSALERLFQGMGVEEPGEAECLLILRGVKSGYESHHGVYIEDPALTAAITLSKRYLPDRRLPDKALDLLDEAASRLYLSMESMPPQLDTLHRTLVEWRIEQQALRDKAPTKATLLGQKIEDKEAELRALEKRWQQEKKQVAEMQVLEQRRVALEKESEAATIAEDYEQAAQIKYGPLLALVQEQETLRTQLPEERDQRLVRQEVDEQDIAEVIADWTGIPVARMLESERSKLLRMESVLGARVKGQEEAVQALSTAIRRSRSGLADPGKPIGSFLFLGSTGVGKTELAKALAEFLFDDEQVLIRFDMSEFMEKQAALRLTGAPPGYAGYQEGGQLTEAIRQHPYAVVLFDEIEKAHPDVFNLLLQVLDDGHLTDSQGRRVDFKNTVVILTSNLGAEALLDGAGLEELRPLLLQTLRPELLNRIDELLCFRPLSDIVLREILQLQWVRLQELLSKQSLGLSCSEEAAALILAAGTDPAFGARPLKRALVQLVQNPLSMKLLEGHFASGDHIVVNVEDGALCFSILPQDSHPASEHPQGD